MSSGPAAFLSFIPVSAERTSLLVKAEEKQQQQHMFPTVPTQATTCIGCVSSISEISYVDESQIDLNKLLDETKC